MQDELKPGVDRPRRGQYVIAVLIIVLLTIAAYFYRRSGEPLPERRPGDVTALVPRLDRCTG